MEILDNHEIDKFFLEKKGFIPSGGVDRYHCFKPFFYNHKKDFRPVVNLFDEYEEDMVHCKWCEFLGLDPMHPKSFIIEDKLYPHCEGMSKYRNSIRTEEELKDSVSNRVIERILKMWQESTGQRIYTQLEIEEYINKRYGKMCFMSGERSDISNDHIFPLIKGWPLTSKNALPLKKTYNSSNCY